ncbi:MAG TPA: TonB family protein [Terriglobales bacterium]|nr:TonB family protein [Terriglobales bacterium]
MALSSLTYEIRRPPRWNTFFVGLLINISAAVLVAAIAPRLIQTQFKKLEVIRQRLTFVAPGPTVNPPRPAPAARQIAKLEAPRIEPPPVVRAIPPAPKIETRSVERPKPELSKVAESQPVAPPKPVPQVKTNVFDSAPAIATVHQPSRQVQTGGFGDPNGVTARTEPNRSPVVVASVGSFDMPAGAGNGNGSAGARGVSGTVRSSGFGDAAVSQNQPAVRQVASVTSSGFDATAQHTRTELKPVEKKPDLQPVEITFKPRPEYTPEALQRHVQGEVLLDVVFTASGSLHINRVVKGLGFGLDDKALAAAQRIRFRPARRDGQPYDCAALVHIVFELAE